MKLQFFEIPQTDRANKDARRQAGDHDPGHARRCSTPPSPAASGVENDVIELSNGGYAWLDVLDITPQKQKPFEEVKAEAKQLTIAQERARLVDRAGQQARRARRQGRGDERRSPPPPAPPRSTRRRAFNRTTTPQGMSRDAVARAFTLAKGEAGSAPDSNDKTRIVFKVTEITPAPRADRGAAHDRHLRPQATRSPTRR